MQFSIKYLRSMLAEPIFRRSQLITSPQFCSWFPHYFKNLHQSAPSSRYTKIHIVLRANDAVMSLNASRQLECIGLRTKSDVIEKCIASLATAAKHFQSTFEGKRISVSVVNDTLSEYAKGKITTLFAPLSVTYVPADSGNGPTFRKQISIAANDTPDTLVAVCEDDYLFDKNALTTAFDLFNTTPRLAGFSPHNHPNVIRLCMPTYIYRLSCRFYQHTSATTCTFFVGSDLIQQSKKLFLKYDGKEENSINRVWAKHICISPCCWTLAEHLHLSELSPVQTLIKQTSKLDNTK